MNNNNNNTVVDKMITKGKEEDYYGIQRTWCVGRLDLGKLLDLPEGAERWGRKEAGKITIDYDFGKPQPGDDPFKVNFNRINRWDFEEVIKQTLDTVMLSGDRNDIIETAKNKLRTDYTVSIHTTTYTKAGGYMNRIDIKLEKVGEETFKDDEITTDLKDIKPYMSSKEYNIRAEIEQPSYITNSKTYNGNAVIDYLVKKMLKEKYTYCTKNGKNIVPDNYILDGEAGIKAYQEEKRSKNKNNSIEKQMVKNLKREKIRFCMDTFSQVMKIMLGEGTDAHDYAQVYLAVDGRWNTSRRLTTVKKQILNVSDDELVMMSEDEIKNRCKNYWKVTLNRAIKHIDDIM